MSPENGSDIQQKIEYVKKSLPKEMADAASKFSPEEFLRRAELYQDLLKSEKTLRDNSQKLTSITSNYQTPLLEITRLKDDLSRASLVTFNERVTTKFEGWDGNDMNFHITGRDTITRGELLARYTRNSKGVKEFLNHETSSASQDARAQQERVRLDTFLGTLEKSSGEAEINAAIARFRLKRNTEESLDELQTVINDNLTNTKGALNLTTVQSSDTKLAQALRAIGDTTGASEVAGRQIAQNKESLNDDGKYNKLNAFIINNRTRFESNAKQEASKTFDEILRSLEGRSEYITYSSQKEAIITGITEQKLFMKLLDTYIAQNGDKTLGPIGEMYNDMRGLYGSFNFTDEHAKLAKEVAIMIASTALTMGAGALLSASAGLARGAALTAGSEKVMKAGRIGRTVSTLKSGTYIGTARAAEVSAQTLAKTGVLGQALVFTGSDTALRMITANDGDTREDIARFGEKFAKNTLMFGALAGMEKFVRGSILARSGLVAKPGLTARVGETAILTSGDVVALYGLHVVENGKMTMSQDEVIQLAAFTLAFRGSMPAFESFYPKISGQISALRQKLGESKFGELTQKAMEGVGKVAGAPGKALRKILPEAKVPKGSTLSQAEFDALKVPEWAASLSMNKKEYVQVVERNAKLGDPERIKAAEDLLKRKLNPEEQAVILAAHNTGTSGIFRWKQGELKGKGSTLSKGIKDPAERRMLMESGLTGKIGGELLVPQQEEIRRLIVNGLKENTIVSLDALGLTGWKVTKIPRSKGKENNQFTLEIPGEAPISIQGRGQLEKTIQTQARERDMGKPKSDTSSEQTITHHELGGIAEKSPSTASENGIFNKEQGISLTRKLHDPKRGDIIAINGKEYRYTASGERWQEKIKDTWAHQDYLEGAALTTNELKKQLMRENIVTNNNETPLSLIDSIGMDVSGGVSKGLKSPNQESSGEISKPETAGRANTEIKPQEAELKINTTLNNNLFLRRMEIDLVADIRKIEENIQAFLKKERISTWDVFQKNLETLKQRERTLRLRDMKQDPGNIRIQGEYIPVEKSLREYEQIKSLVGLKKSKLLELQNVRELHPEIQAFLKKERISNWDVFQKNLETLKQRERTLRLRDMKQDPGNIRIQGEYIPVEKSLREYEYIDRLRKLPPGFEQELQSTINRLNGFKKQPTNTQDSGYDGSSVNKAAGSPTDSTGVDVSGGGSKTVHPAESNTQSGHDGPLIVDDFGNLTPGRKPNPIVDDYGNIVSENPGASGKPQTQPDTSNNPTEVIIGTTPNPLPPHENPGIGNNSGSKPNTSHDVPQPIYTPVDGNGFAHPPYRPGQHDPRGRVKPDTSGKPQTQPDTSNNPTEVIEPPKDIQSNPEKARDWTTAKWTLGGLLLLGGLWYIFSGDENNKTVTPIDTNKLTPPYIPIGPAITIDQACHDIGTQKGSIDFKRNNGIGAILSENRRENITKRFMQSREFQTFKTFVQNNLTDIQTKTACNNILALLDNPTVVNIQELQRHVNMNASDDKNGQDGILGPITLKQLQTYLEVELAK